MMASSMASASVTSKLAAFRAMAMIGQRLPIVHAVVRKQLGDRSFNLRPGCSRAYRSSVETAGGVSLVQGSSRGIGLEFVRQLLANRKEGCVVATCRDPGGAEYLDALCDQYPERLEVIRLDVMEPDSIEAAAKHVAENYKRVDLLVNAGGVLHIPNIMQPETSLAKCNLESLTLAYQVNAAGPLLVAKAMYPLLKAGGGKGTGRPAAVIANLSARVGSIGDNKLGGWYAYRASKSALNQLTKTMSVEFMRKRDPIITVLLHPGTVDTDLSKPFQGNVPDGKLFTPEYSVGQLLNIIDGLKTGDTGRFYDWDGKEILW